MTANATFVLDDKQKRQLAQVYRFILSLSERRKNETADGGTWEGDATAASTPAEEPEQGQ